MQVNGIASALLFFCLLSAASLWDIRRRVIPDSLCLAIAAVGLFTFLPVKLLGLLPALLLLCAALFLRGGAGMGGGDIKLTAASGFVLGLPAASAGVILGMGLALLCYLPLHAIRKRNKGEGQALSQTALPLAPFLSIGFITAAIIERIEGTTL